LTTFKHRSALLGAAFLMATSAIGPGFLTQTTVFTVELGASFAFVILLSVLLDLGAQLNIWRIVTAAGRPAPELAEAMLPGLGRALTVLIVLGGLAFNIGNLAGTGLGLQVLTGLPTGVGAALSAGIALAIFWQRAAGRALDTFTAVLGLGMIALTAYAALASHPPLKPVFTQAIFPEKVDWKAVITLVGGTVGGYITFAGAHRLLEAGVRGPEQTGAAQAGALRGILIATVMRVVLFLAAWGVVAGGAAIDPANPPASLFRLAAGDLGYYFFGVVMWSAAITSVVGATFTSVSFLLSVWPEWGNRRRLLTAIFIGISLAVFLLVGRPVKTLIYVGALNGLILPVSLAVMLLAARRHDVVPQGATPGWLAGLGWVVVALMGAMAVAAVLQINAG